MSAKEEMLAMKKALAWLLVKERKRHLKDIAQIDCDIAKLRAKGIPIPDEKDVDEEAWVEA